MSVSLTAQAETTVDAPTPKVWAALTDPAAIKKYFFGSDVTSEWKVGSEIVWEGEWQGKKYRDHGKILQMEPNRVMAYTHFSPLAGQPDLPENYHTVTIRLETAGSAAGVGTRVVLTQDNNNTPEEQQHSAENWGKMLAGLKGYLEA